MDGRVDFPVDELIPKVTRPLYEYLKILNKRPVNTRQVKGIKYTGSLFSVSSVETMSKRVPFITGHIFFKKIACLSGTQCMFRSKSIALKW